MRRRDRRAILGAVGLALALMGPGGLACAPGGRPEGADTLTIGAYSVVREAFHEALLPAFARHWTERTGRAVRFEESYNGSGAQTRAILGGFDADVAVLSLEGDVKKLVEAGLVREDWRDGPHGGMITRSLVVIGVRPGDPKRLRDWDDLARPGVAVVYPDPKTSGGAKWNVNALYGAGLRRGGPEAARALLAAVQANVLNMDASGRQSMATFDRGTGDAIVTYENELLLQQKVRGRPAPYAIPPATLLIEGPAAIVEASVKRHGNRAVAEAFLAFLRSEEAQRLLAAYGFRPLDPSHDVPGRPPLPPDLFTMADLGGWKTIDAVVYGPGGVWDSLFTQKLARGGGRP